MTAKIYFSKLDENTLPGTFQSNTVIGREGINMLNANTYTYWETDLIGSAVIAVASYDTVSEILITYFAFDNHNLFNKDDITAINLIAATDPFFSTSFTLATILKADIVDGANIKEFVNNTSYRYYAIEITHTSAFTENIIIGNLSLGEPLQLPEGIKASYTPPRFGINSNVTNNNSGSNNFIGRSVKRSNYEFILKNENVDVSWMRSNWNDLYNYIEQKPFFYLWNDLYTNDAVYSWTVNKIAAPKYQDTCNMSFSIKCEGFRQ